MKSPIHFHYVLHAKRGEGGEGVQIACKIAYVLNGRPLSHILYKKNMTLIFKKCNSFAHTHKRA